MGSKAGAHLLGFGNIQNPLPGVLALTQPFFIFLVVLFLLNGDYVLAQNMLLILKGCEQ